jgi:hypothetical protein
MAGNTERSVIVFIGGVKEFMSTAPPPAHTHKTLWVPRLYNMFITLQQQRWFMKPHT